jgi:tRNA-dihydrouridine synthase A
MKMSYNTPFIIKGHFFMGSASPKPILSSLEIAPMIDWSYSYFRVLMRILAPNALIYTEMQTPGAIFHQPERALGFYEMENPLALQLGGSEPDVLAKCAKIAEDRGFREINLNLGCPSDRVQAGRFGACLMSEPQRVADCIAAMKQAVSIPVTAKTRIGIDKEDSYEFFSSFAHRLIDAGCDKLIVHARKAWLHGLNPKQNRTIPPVCYDYVYRIKQEIPTIPVVINGNVNDIDDIRAHLQHTDGVMLGRLACQNPYAIATIHHALYPEIPLLSRFEAVSQYASYIEMGHQKKVPISLLLKPIFSFAHGLPGARRWKAELMAIQQSGNINELASAMMMFE